MNNEILLTHDATQLRQAISRKEISPVELVEGYLGRIAQYDKKLNSYITVCRDAALSAAREAEKAISRGDPVGPLHGLPLAVKDQFETQGVLTTGASSILAKYIPEEDATVVARARSAGAILLGKLNMTEFAAGGGDHYKFGDPPRNPWNFDRTPGVSSAGSAIAIAASLCSISLGEDTGGSIRGPASFCGIVGLRPTWGRVSRRGMLPFSWSMDTAGPMTRSVEDAALLMNVIAGHDPKDPQTSQLRIPDYTKGLNGDIRTMRVGILHEYVNGSGVNTEVADAIRAAAEQLRHLGATVTEVSLPMLLDMGTAYAIVSESEAGDVHAKWLRTRYRDYGHNIRRRILAATLIPGHTLQKAMHMRGLLRREWFTLFNDVDILLTPTSPTPAGRMEYVDGISDFEEANRRFGGSGSPTTPVAFVGAPALSVPCGFTSDGLPIGLQIVGSHFREDQVFRVGYAYQEATGWHRERPRLSK
jgi:aspartyl-tRNA(Asn)/glutamyl-tRNA(Gln) amidotransferase subunit A